MQGISFTQLYNEHLDFVVRPGHPLLEAPDIRRIGDWPVIYPPEGAAIRALVERLLIAQGVGVPPRRLETVSGAFGRNYVPTSDAIWIISAGVVAKEVQEGRLAACPSTPPCRSARSGWSPAPRPRRPRRRRSFASRSPPPSRRWGSEPGQGQAANEVAGALRRDRRRRKRLGGTPSMRLKNRLK